MGRGSFLGVRGMRDDASGREDAFLKKRGTVRQPLREVDVEDGHRGSTHGRSSDQSCALPLEVLGPPILPWMEEPGQLARARIKPSDVRPLVQIAVEACESEVVDLGGSIVLLRDDMVNVERQRIEFLGHAAVFTDRVCPSPHFCLESVPHTARSRLGPCASQ